MAVSVDIYEGALLSGLRGRYFNKNHIISAFRGLRGRYFNKNHIISAFRGLRGPYLFRFIKDTHEK